MNLLKKNIAAPETFSTPPPPTQKTSQPHPETISTIKNSELLLTPPPS